MYVCLEETLLFDDIEEQVFANELQSLINLKVGQMPPQRQQIFHMSRVD